MAQDLQSRPGTISGSLPASAIGSGRTSGMTPNRHALIDNRSQQAFSWRVRRITLDRSGTDELTPIVLPYRIKTSSDEKGVFRYQSRNKAVCRHLDAYQLVISGLPTTRPEPAS